MNNCLDCNNKNQIANNGHYENINREAKFSAMPWFHGKISREEAETLLQPRTDGLFLVRESTNFPGDYTLCVCYQNKVEHYRVKYHERNLTIDDEEFFENLEKLIEHYKNDADGLCTRLVKALPKENTTTTSHADDLCIINEQELEVRMFIGVYVVYERLFVVDIRTNRQRRILRGDVRQMEEKQSCC